MSEMNKDDAMNMMVVANPSEITDYEYNDIIAQAERAEKLVDALNKMMNAAIRITSKLDWVLIGGKPYLQESGATKVARLFGIGWRVIQIDKELDEGYPAFTYRMEFTMGKNRIECEGSRTGKDEFFAGKNRTKGPDQIDKLDVKKAAYTNCINNGIKRMLPGLRNIDVANLQAGGIDLSGVSGYTFKTGSKGGSTGRAEDSGLFCEGCGAPITQKVASFSQAKFGKALCMNCQKTGAQVHTAQAIAEEAQEDLPF